MEGIFFDASAAKDKNLVCEVHAEGEVFHISIENGELQIAFGFAKGESLIIEVTPKCLLELCARILEPDKALKDKSLVVRSGTELDVKTMLDIFSKQTQSSRIPSVQIS